MARTGQHPWLHSRWIDYWSNTNGDHRFRCEDNKVAFTNVQPHYYRVRQVDPCDQLGLSSQTLLLNIYSPGAKQQQKTAFRRNGVIFGVFDKGGTRAGQEGGEG